MEFDGKDEYDEKNECDEKNEYDEFDEYYDYYEYYDKGYVIRCVDPYNGRVFYRGPKERYVTEKDALMPNETYTISGAKRAKANLERMYPDVSFYSIERLSCYYLNYSDREKKDDYRSDIYKGIAHAMKRLDELWNGNDFDNGDKMRINEVRSDLRMIKTILLQSEKSE